jgi:hypothetical protein
MALNSFVTIRTLALLDVDARSVSRNRMKARAPQNFGITKSQRGVGKPARPGAYTTLNKTFRFE